MKNTLLVKEEAVQDMTEAFSWYEQKRMGLGVEFLDEVEEFFDHITRHPEHYQSYQNQRVAVLHRFPFRIVYEVEQEATIVVYAVYHDKRDPAKLSHRE